MNFKERAQNLYDMMAKGQMNEAFEKYYAENVVVVESPTGEVRNGKEAQRQAIATWVANVQDNHGGGVNAITSDESNKTTMVQSWTDVTMKHDQSRMKMEEVAVQQWNEDGQIVHEQFYYQMGPPPQQAG